MGISEGYKRIAEQRKAAWIDFEERCQSAGLTPPSREDFDGVQPKTRNGWKKREQLLEAEGSLNDVERQKILRGLELISIYERRDEIRRRLEAGEDLPDPQWPNVAQNIPAEVALSQQASEILLWTAIKELGLDRTSTYDGYFKQAQLQMYRIAKARGDF